MIMNMVLAGSLLLVPAAAPDPGGAGGGDSSSVRVEADQKGRTSGLTLKNSQIIVSGNGRGGKSDGYRLKRPCWYEPAQNPEDMLRYQQSVNPRPDPDAPQTRQKALEPFADKLGEEGRWWVVAHDSSDPNGVGCQMAMDPYVFVPPGTTPPNGITMAELADIARAALTVPEPAIELSPDAKSYVNLPTWVWLSGAGETTRSVTATLPGVMSATVTANLRDIEIDPGTTDDKRAKVTTSGCGASGTPYAKGAAFTCGVNYLRASVDQPRGVYELTVTSVWDVGVEDDAVPVAYDPIEASATRDVPVGEVQSTVRKTG
ncbi:hypothetical protein ACLQ2R_23000 [Streptosporangium sp. DT93]|uniref:hypothetical protein n=1 Tax=Streptosporangium sp. DT93 TaxID=3393428 RepID=UPI003CF5ED1C